LVGGKKLLFCGRTAPVLKAVLPVFPQQQRFPMSYQQDQGADNPFPTQARPAADAGFFDFGFTKFW
jgi:hypothetical protein